MPNKNNLQDLMQFKRETDDCVDLYIYGDIVCESMCKWYDEDTYPLEVKEMINAANGRDINVHINSGGGSVFAGIAIYNMLKNYEGTVTTYIDGLAASISSVIAMAGDRIVMRVGSNLMVHKPSIVMIGAYNADDLSQFADTLDAIQDSIMQVYMDRMRPEASIDEIEELVNAETWMTSEEAIKYFDIEEDRLEAVASVNSEFVERYLKAPPQYAQEEEDTNDEDKEARARMQMELDFLNLGGK